jgi:nucleoside-diphosphate-sugar epimerase
MKPTKILITGGNGFLGSSLINKISKKNYILHLLVREKSNLSRLNLNKKIKLFQLQEKNLENIFKINKYDLVIHCATNYGIEEENSSNTIYPNLLLPLKLLDLAKKYSVKSFINTDTILNKNISSYTLSKNQFVDWLKLFSKFLNCYNVKLEHFYGPKDNNNKFIINNICRLLRYEDKIEFTKGFQKRDFIYISDVVNALEKIILLALKNNKNNLNLFTMKTFEIGTGRQISIKSIILLIAKLIGNNKTRLEFGKLPFRKNEIVNVKVDLKNIRKLGWNSKLKLERGLTRTINYYKKII